MILSPSRKKRVLLMLIVLIAGLAIYTASIVHFGYAQTPFVKNTLKQYEFSAIKPEMLPKGWLNDLLMIEDPQFYQHSGIDLTTDGAGLTTITQGLVKIYYFDSFKPGVAKYKQSILALILDSQVSKNDQLTLFLNTARLGHIEGESIRGFQRASRAYFNKNFIDLTHSEYLSLVAMLVGPSQFNVAKHPEINASRVRRIQLLLDRACSAKGLTDVYYVQCQ